MRVSIIAAMAKNRVIGIDNGLPWHLPEDLKHFKETTQGKTIIMGRKTFESMGRALPKRRNIVVSRNPEFEAEGCEVTSSLERALELCRQADDQEVFIIGGHSLFKDGLNIADRLYLTVIDKEFEGDTYFPAYSLDSYNIVRNEQHQQQASEDGKLEKLDFAFVTAERKKK